MRRWVEIAATATATTRTPHSTAIKAARHSPAALVGVPRGEPDDRKPRRRDDHADPLAPPESEAEEALGEDGEEHQPAREDGLHDRQRREGERADVKHPGADRHRPANREPPRAEEVGGASQRVPDPHRGREDRAAVLEQKGDARRDGAGRGRVRVRRSRRRARASVAVSRGRTRSRGRPSHLPARKAARLACRHVASFRWVPRCADRKRRCRRG